MPKVIFYICFLYLYDFFLYDCIQLLLQNVLCQMQHYLLFIRKNKKLKSIEALVMWLLKCMLYILIIAPSPAHSFFLVPSFVFQNTQHINLVLPYYVSH